MKKQFYVQDPTTGNFVYFDTVPQLVDALGELTQKLFGLTRKQYTQNLEDMNMGTYDDAQGAMFTRAMSEQCNIGVVRADGQHVKTNVHEATNFQGSEYSDVAQNRFEDRGKW
jgi:hypothetical protein